MFEDMNLKLQIQVFYRSHNLRYDNPSNKSNVTSNNRSQTQSSSLHELAALKGKQFATNMLMISLSALDSFV